MPDYKYIYPNNARNQEQLDIMLNMEAADKDPMAPEYIDQKILFTTDFWHISENRFPYENAEKQFLIVAKNPVYQMADISPAMWVDLQQIWQKLAHDYQLDGGAICMRFGNPAKSGATLTRVHAHIIMPELNQKVKFTVGGRTTLKEGLHL